MTDLRQQIFGALIDSEIKMRNDEAKNALDRIMAIVDAEIEAIKDALQYEIIEAVDRSHGDF